MRSSGISTEADPGGCTMMVTMRAPRGRVACRTASSPAKIRAHWFGSPTTASLRTKSTVKKPHAPLTYAQKAASLVFGLARMRAHAFFL